MNMGLMLYIMYDMVSCILSYQYIGPLLSGIAITHCDEIFATWFGQNHE